MNTELEEMRQQMAVLKKKLEQQEIVNERLISKTKESLEKDMATVRRKYKMGYVVSILMVPFFYYIVVYRFGLSVALGIFTAIWAFVTFIHYYWRKGHLYDMHSALNNPIYLTNLHCSSKVSFRLAPSTGRSPNHKGYVRCD